MRYFPSIMNMILFILLIVSTPLSAKNNYYFDQEKCKSISIVLGERLIEIEEIFQTLIDVSGKKGDYYLCPVHRTSGAFALNSANSEGNVFFDKQYIGYNSDFMQSIYDESGYWGVSGVLSHELAHHLLGHTKDSIGSRPKTELDADFFAGELMQHTGASQADVIILPSQPFMASGGSTHPDGRQRIEAFRSGWISGCQEHPTPQCPNQGHRLTTVIDDPLYQETDGYLRLITLANQRKGYGTATEEYCQLYVNVSVKQATRNEQKDCGYYVDTHKHSRWSKREAGQYKWCMGGSPYATEGEAIFREKKLKECILKAK